MRQCAPGHRHVKGTPTLLHTVGARHKTTKKHNRIGRIVCSHFFIVILSLVILFRVSYSSFCFLFCVSLWTFSVFILLTFQQEC